MSDTPLHATAPAPTALPAVPRDILPLLLVPALMLAMLPLVGSGMVLHYLFLWHERRHAVALHKEVYHKPKY